MAGSRWLAGVVVEIACKARCRWPPVQLVTNADIAEALKAQGFDIEKASIRMPDGPLKTVSRTTIDIALSHTDDGQITVAATGEQ